MKNRRKWTKREKIAYKMAKLACKILNKKPYGLQAFLIHPDDKQSKTYHVSFTIYTKD